MLFASAKIKVDFLDLVSKKIFILGVGAQKAGTTWLASELSKLNVDFPFGKEGHVWTSIEKGNTNIDPENIPLLLDKKKNVQQRVLASIETPDKYFDICDAVYLSQNRPISDITPIYCSLEKRTLCRIREGLINRGFTVRVLFIARDPFSRTWSMHRMGIKRQLRNNPEQIWRADPENAYKNFLASHLSEFQQVRTKYEKILPKLFDVFSRDEIKIFFYENLFSTDTYFSICNFLGLPAAAPAFDRIRNKSTELPSPPINIQRVVVNSYKPTYEYMRQTFPVVQRLWADGYGLVD